MNIIKTSILVLLISTTILSCKPNIKKVSNQEILTELNLLNENQHYFKLKMKFDIVKNQLSINDSLFYQAIIYKVFNKTKLSNNTIEKLLSANEKLNDTLLNKIYRIKLANSINLFEYSKAAETSEYIQENFQKFSDSLDTETLKNEINIWTALKNISKQEIFKSKDVIIPMTKDKAGLFNIDVTINKTTKNFFFIKRSLLSEFKLEIIKSDFYVTSSTGTKVKSDIAIARELKIGEITVKNVFFLVLEDNDFSFPQIDYFPNGAIGFPVIRALEEIRINKKSDIFIPKNPVEYTYNNFALNGLQPIIACEYNGDLLRFSFDTGANTTTLYPQFHKDYQSHIEKTFPKETFHTASAGGTKSFEGYTIELPLKVANSEANLTDVALHIENIGGKKSNFHGNFGQDYIKKFDNMIISFKYSSILFE